MIITIQDVTYQDARNPRWANAEQTVIELEVDFDHLPGWSPFGAVATGDYAHTHEIYARAVAGDFGPIADYDGD